MIRIAFGLALAGLTVLSGGASAETAITRIYLSQGEWRGLELTASGRQIFAEAVQQSTPSAVTEIDINGMADLAPNPESQKRISDGRVAAARAEMVRLGMAAADIDVLPVLTADGSVPTPGPDLLAKRMLIVVHY